MEIIPPYLASTAWLQGKIAPDSIKTRYYTRSLIESNSPEGMVLTVPVVGGSSAVKRHQPNQLEISGHGDWTRIHLGAIEAAYGREPYFIHFFPQISSIIEKYPKHLATFNVVLMNEMMDLVGFKDASEEIKKFKEDHPERFKNIFQRLESKINPDHSFLEPLFRLGPDAIFLL